MRAPAADSDSFADFYASMPARYRELFDASAAREHAAILRRRGDQLAHVELWRRVKGATAVVCVVADDRPGLLSLISAALVAHGLDVIAVQAYTRPSNGKYPAEAVDFFWLRRPPPRSDLVGAAAAAVLASPVLASDITRIADALRGLLAGSVKVEDLLREGRVAPPPPPGASTRVTFDEDPARRVILTVETFDRPGLLLAITRALFRAGVQILGSEATTKDGRVVDRFTVVERDGSPIFAQRRGILQMEVLSAIESLSFRQ
jgi:[protein-PII] uridylyltransferase